MAENAVFWQEGNGEKDWGTQNGYNEDTMVWKQFA